MHAQLKKLATKVTPLAGTLAIVTFLFCTKIAFADSFVNTYYDFPFDCPLGNVYLTGDFDGNKREDLICFTRNSSGDFAGNVYVALSTDPDEWFQYIPQKDIDEKRFDITDTTNIIYKNVSAPWHYSFCYGEEICQVGDFNRDGLDDIAAFVRSTKLNGSDGDVFVALSNGHSFDEPRRWHESFCYGQELCQVGDFNGDGRDDIVAFVRSSKSYEEEGDVWVSLSYGGGFLPATRWQDSFCIGDEVCQVGDFNGDGLQDIVSFARSSSYSSEGIVTIATSNGFTGFGSPQLLNPYFCIGEEVCEVGDFNGDRVDDIVAFVRSTKYDNGAGDVFIATTNPWNLWGPLIWHDYFCVGNEICQVGDFNGDGADDIGLFNMDSGSDYVTVMTARVPPPDVKRFTRDDDITWEMNCFTACEVEIVKPTGARRYKESYPSGGSIKVSLDILSIEDTTGYKLHATNRTTGGKTIKEIENLRPTYQPPLPNHRLHSVVIQLKDSTLIDPINFCRTYEEEPALQNYKGRITKITNRSNYKLRVTRPSGGYNGNEESFSIDLDPGQTSENAYGWASDTITSLWSVSIIAPNLDCGAMPDDVSLEIEFIVH